MIRVWAKIKKALAWVGWVFAVIAGILFASKKKKKRDITPEEIKEALDKARQQVEEEKKKLEEARKKIDDVRKQTDEEVEHAKEVEVPSDPAAVADALNDVLDRARGGGQGGGAERQNCDGCAGRN